MFPGRTADNTLPALAEPGGAFRQVLVPFEADDVDTYEEWLAHLRGSRVQIRVPQRGDKRELLETVTRNAKDFEHTGVLVRNPWDGPG